MNQQGSPEHPANWPSEMMTIIYLAAIGFAVGIFVGISGVGGGSIMTPILLLVLRINPLTAVGTDLLYSVPTRIFGAFLHVRQGTVDWGIVRRLLTGGIPGVLLGIFLLGVLRHTMDIGALNMLVKRGVGTALIISAVALAYSIVTRRAPPGNPAGQTGVHGWRAPALITSGAVVGFFVAVTSIGSGAMTMPLLLFIVPLAGIRRLVGSDITYAAFLIPTAAFGHIALHDVNYGIAASLLIGSLPGVFVGTRLCRRLPEIWLRPAVAMILVIAGWRLF